MPPIPASPIPSAAALFAEALEHHRAGRLAAAVAGYAQVLERDPAHLGSLYHLGLIARQDDRLIDALDLFSRLTLLRPTAPEGHANRADVLVRLGRLDDAIQTYRTLLGLRPDLAQIHGNLGLLLARQGRTEEAVASYRTALTLRPDLAEAHNNLGAALTRLGHPEEAIASYRQALSHRPDYAEAALNLGVLLKRLGRLEEAETTLRLALSIRPGLVTGLIHLGDTLIGLHRPDQAIAVLRDAVARDPAAAPAWTDLGRAFWDLGDLEQAETALNHAIALAPTLAEAHIRLGNVLAEQYRLDEAIGCYEAARILAPDNPDVHNNLGKALFEQGDAEAAHACYRTALALAPDHAEAHNNLGLALLQAGDFAQGWDEAEWRWAVWRKKGLERADFPVPVWQGEDLSGRTLIVHAEQGHGDVLQFARFLPALAARGARVVVEAFPPLVRLIAAMPGVEAVFATGQPWPAADFRLPLLSTPHRLGIALDDLPAAPIPYLHPDDAAVARWRDILAAHPGPRIGLVWAGGVRPHDPRANFVDLRRSLPLARLAPLLDARPDATFVSLQKGPAAAQAADAALPRALFDPMAGMADFADTAALIAALDLVIGVDTAVIHLAGALGRPVWMLSRFDSCWRWMRNRTDSPWYPTLRLYRQSAPWDWDPLIAAAAADLARWRNDAPPTSMS